MCTLKLHNIFDYIIAFALLFSPGLLGLNSIYLAQATLTICGALLFSYSIFTNYQYAAFRWLPLGTHMTLDAALGVVLCLSPRALGFRDLLSTGQEAAFYLGGFTLLGLLAITRSKTEYEKNALEPRYQRPPIRKVA